MKRNRKLIIPNEKTINIKAYLNPVSEDDLVADIKCNCGHIPDLYELFLPLLLATLLVVYDSYLILSLTIDDRNNICACLPAVGQALVAERVRDLQPERHEARQHPPLHRSGEEEQ